VDKLVKASRQAKLQLEEYANMLKQENLEAPKG
jgi:hypothetical protein